MAADALIVGGLLLVLSAWRFGEDWAVWWRQIVPQPEAFLLLYAVGWLTVLTSVGLYRPRARLSIWSESKDVLRLYLGWTQRRIDATGLDEIMLTANRFRHRHGLPQVGKKPEWLVPNK